MKPSQAQSVTRGTSSYNLCPVPLYNYLSQCFVLGPLFVVGFEDQSVDLLTRSRSELMSTHFLGIAFNGAYDFESIAHVRLDFNANAEIRIRGIFLPDHFDVVPVRDAEGPVELKFT